MYIHTYTYICTSVGDERTVHKPEPNEQCLHGNVLYFSLVDPWFVGYESSSMKWDGPWPMDFDDLHPGDPGHVPKDGAPQDSVRLPYKCSMVYGRYIYG